MDKNYNTNDKHSIMSKHNVNNDKRLNQETLDEDNIQMQQIKTGKPFF